MRRTTIGILGSVLAIVLLAGCSSSRSTDRKPVSTPTPVYVAWQRPQVPVSQTAARVRLSGVMRLHQSTVNDVAFSASGTRLATIGADDTVVVWNLANGDTLFVGTGNDGRHVFFGPDDATLITVSPEGVARVWALPMEPPRHLEAVTEFTGHILMGPIAQSPDRTLLAFGSQSGGVRLWRVPEGELVADFPAHQGAVQFLTFSPDGTLLVTLGADRGVYVWSVPAGTLVKRLSDPEAAEVLKTTVRAAFSPDGSHLALAYQNGIDVYEVQTGTLLYTVNTAKMAGANALVFSPDGALLAGCGTQPLVGVWRAADGAQLGLLSIPGQVCSNVLFSPDSTLLLTLPQPGRDLYLWNILHITDDVPPEEKLLERADRQTMELPSGTRFFNVAWSPDGRFIVVLDELGPIYVLTATE